MGRNLYTRDKAGRKGGEKREREREGRQRKITPFSEGIYFYRCAGSRAMILDGQKIRVTRATYTASEISRIPALALSGK